MAGHNIDDMSEDAVAPDNGSREENDNIIEEYNMLDTKLDELNSALDFLEQKNDTIHAQLMELLNSNREIRQQLQQENSAMQDATGSKQSSPQ